MSMRGLGRRIDTKISVLSRANTGKMCPTIALVDRIASALGCDYNSLIERTERGYYGMELFETFEKADSAGSGLSPLDRVHLADEKSKELLRRAGDLDKRGMEIRACF